MYSWNQTFEVFTRITCSSILCEWFFDGSSQNRWYSTIAAIRIYDTPTTRSAPGKLRGHFCFGLVSATNPNHITRRTPLRVGFQYAIPLAEFITLRKFARKCRPWKSPRNALNAIGASRVRVDVPALQVCA